ncbi:MAG: hypothetical protein GC204_00870 [Chloroflexi bacterium]|nr:hypothetical protein [Chloroflexota bacterium]
MLRFWVMVSLLLTTVFTGIGLLVSRAWGWSEYASDELYLVYSYLDYHYDIQYFIVNADGSDTPKKLTWNDGFILRMGCSPDGKTFAFATKAHHLYVLTNSGLSYDRSESRAFGDMDVMNDQSVGLYVDQAQTPYVATVHPDGTSSIEPRPLYRWLASQQIYIAYPGVLKDNQSGLSAPLQYPFSPSTISPDGLKGAQVTQISGIHNDIYIANFFSKESPLQFPNENYWAANATCFLTFRPQMLTAGSKR